MQSWVFRNNEWRYDYSYALEATNGFDAFEEVLNRFDRPNTNMEYRIVKVTEETIDRVVARRTLKAKRN